MRRFAWIVTLPISVIVIVFAVMNRQAVELDIWPLPWNVSAPLFLLTLGLVLFGFLLGVVVMWFTGGKQRRRSRELKRDLDAARSDLHMARQQAAAAPRSTGTALATTRDRLPPAA